jgi:CheY-like chemotaxis protein
MGPGGGRSADAVLIVEAPEICAFLGAFLQQLGYREILAAPEDGLRVLRERRDEISLLITNQPLRFLPERVPILYIAAMPDPDVAALCLATLRKPFKHWDLLGALERARVPRLARSARKPWVLAVDDDPQFLECLAGLLRRENCQVLQARDGEEALVMLDRFHALLDLAIVDLVLPKRNGYEVIGEVARQPELIKILAASAVRGGPELQATRELGAHAWLEKPRFQQNLREDEWLDTVHRLLADCRAACSN